MAETEKKERKLTFKLSMYSLMGVAVFLAIGVFIKPVFLVSLAFSLIGFGSLFIHSFKNWKIPLLMKIATVGTIGTVLFLLNGIIWKVSSDSGFSFAAVGDNIKKSGLLHAFDIKDTVYMQIFLKIVGFASVLLAFLSVVSFVMFILYKMFRLMTKIVKSNIMRAAITLTFMTTVARLIGIKVGLALFISAILLVLTMLCYMIFMFTIKKLNIAGRALMAFLTATGGGVLLYFLFDIKGAAGRLGFSENKVIDFMGMYFTVLIALSLVSLFLFIILAVHSKLHISASFLIADVIFTLMSLGSYFIFSYELIHLVSTYALCAFGFGVGVGIMWTAAVKIFKKKITPPPPAAAPMPSRPKLSSLNPKKPEEADKKPEAAKPELK